MRNHLEAHRMGQYDGIIPANWLEAQRLVTFGHCNRLVVGTEGAMHRTCRAEARSTDASSVSPIDLPAGSSSAIDVEGILLANRPSLRYIPKKCRTVWSAVLSRALSAVVLVSSAGSRCTPGQRDLAWAELICLSKAVLTPTPRGGRRHPRCQENHTKCLLQRWLHGDKALLYADAKRSVAKRRPTNHCGARIARAISLVEEGKDSQACKTLTSDGLAPSSAATRRALEAKHPRGEPAAPKLAQAPALFEAIKGKAVLEALRGFAKGTAPGPSGLRAQHLLDAVGAAEQGAVLEAWSM